MATTQERLNATLARADEVLRQRVERDEAKLAEEAAEQARATVEQVRNDSFRCREIAEIYDAAFSTFGVETPPPVDGERPGAYRKRLFTRLQRRLPASSELVDVRADDLTSPTTRDYFEASLIAAARKEGLTPSFDNLPPDNSLIERMRVDPDTGRKVRQFYGRSSFIADMSRPGRKVAAIVDPNRHVVLWGAPLQRTD